MSDETRLREDEALITRILDERRELKAEVERLRAESQENYDLWQRAEAWGSERHDEVERLREQLRNTRLTSEAGWAEVERLRAEVNHPESD